MRAGERGERTAIRVLGIAFLLPALYLLSACVVFDFTSSAQDLCQEYDNEGRFVAHGPEPRVRLCRPRRYDIPGGASWSGKEWAFTAYRPVCSAWLILKGYGRAHRCDA